MSAFHEPFPFSYLPPLVRWKILRQYVPFTEKVVLGQMPEFACLLDREQPCWQYSSKSFYRLLPSLCALEPGLYVKSGDPLPHYGYKVRWLPDACVSFTFYNFFQWWVTPYEKPYEFHDAGVGDFIEAFLRQYVRMDPSIKIYHSKHNGLVVNTSRKLILWHDLTVHAIHRNGGCFIQQGEEQLHFYVDPYDHVVAQFKNGKVEEELRSLSIEQCRWSLWKVFECRFYIAGKSSLKTTLEIENVLFFRYFTQECPVVDRRRLFLLHKYPVGTECPVPDLKRLLTLQNDVTKFQFRVNERGGGGIILT